jgi:DNA-binding Lrp family transcriptional regulator
MAAFEQEVRGGDHPAVRRRQHGGVVADPDQGLLAGRQPRGQRVDQPELTELAQITGRAQITGSDSGLLSHNCATGLDHYGSVSPHGAPVPLCPRRTPMVEAYILVQTEVGKAADVARQIAKISGVTQAEDVTGPYDVIVRAQAENVDELGRLVAANIQHVPGITRTLTCPVVHI